jgi:urea transport system substrate-binding protein
MAAVGQAVINATLFAVDEINQAGGVLGRKLVPNVADGQSDDQTFADEARRLIVENEVSVLFACVTSAHRRSIEPVVEGHGRLLVYPGESEGLKQSPNVVCLGPLPNQTIFPAIAWLRDTRRKRRFFLIGSDAIYAHAVAAILGDAAERLSVELVGDAYINHDQFQESLAMAIEQLEAVVPDAILNLCQGQLNVALITRLREHQITPERIPLLSACFSEHDLVTILRATVGDYVCGHYFEGLKTPENVRFLKRVRESPRLSGTPIVSDSMVAAYMGVHLWASAAARAGTVDDLAAIRRAMVGVTLPGPGGPVRVDPATQCDAKFARVARIGQDRRLALEWSSKDPIAPIAYPDSRTPAEWDDFVRETHTRWGGRWRNGAGAPPRHG